MQNPEMILQIDTKQHPITGKECVHLLLEFAGTIGQQVLLSPEDAATLGDALKAKAAAIRFGIVVPGMPTNGRPV